MGFLGNIIGIVFKLVGGLVVVSMIWLMMMVMLDKCFVVGVVMEILFFVVIVGVFIINYIMFVEMVYGVVMSVL